MKTQDMRFLIVGLGSMGKRRIRNLHELGIRSKQILGTDIRDDRCLEAQSTYGIQTSSDPCVAMSEDIDAVVVSAPPDLHTYYALQAVEMGKHFFLEVSVTIGDLPELINRLRKTNLVGVPSCTMTFHPAIKLIKSLLDRSNLGRIYSFSHHFGHYLPDWHPWESVQDFYVGKRETGGCRELVCFEFIWLNMLFGSLKRVFGFNRKLSDLPVDIDDIYQILWEFESGVLGHSQVDVLARNPYRTIRIIGSEGSIEWDWNAEKVRWKVADEPSWQEYTEPQSYKHEAYPMATKEGMYVDELKMWLRAIEGATTYPFTLEDDLGVLRILLALEASSETGQCQEIP